VQPANRIVGLGFDACFSLLQPLPVAVTLALLAALTAAAWLSLIRASTDQCALAAVKRQMHADLLEIRLFHDDLRSIFRAERDFLRHNGAYLRLSLLPALWMVIPALIVIPQLEAYFGHGGTAVRQSILVTAQLASNANSEATLNLPPGIRAETPAVWFPELRQLIWRVTADQSGDYRLQLRVGAQTYDKSLLVSDQLARRSPTRTTAGFLNELFHPSERPLPSGAPVESIGIEYQDRYFEILGWRVSWGVLYLGEVILFAAVLKRPLRVNL
jgi:hypothetical protein